jgi:hypothetical protein
MRVVAEVPPPVEAAPADGPRGERHESEHDDQRDEQPAEHPQDGQVLHG